MKIVEKIISKFREMTGNDKKSEKEKPHKGRPEKKHPKHFDKHHHDDDEDEDDDDDRIY